MFHDCARAHAKIANIPAASTHRYNESRRSLGFLRSGAKFPRDREHPAPEVALGQRRVRLNSGYNSGAPRRRFESMSAATR